MDGANPHCLRMWKVFVITSLVFVNPSQTAKRPVLIQSFFSCLPPKFLLSTHLLHWVLVSRHNVTLCFLSENIQESKKGADMAYIFWPLFIFGPKEFRTRSAFCGGETGVYFQERKALISGILWDWGYARRMHAGVLRGGGVVVLPPRRCLEPNGVSLKRFVCVRFQNLFIYFLLDFFWRLEPFFFFSNFRV